jgi:hypothetical protein
VVERAPKSARGRWFEFVRWVLTADGYEWEMVAGWLVDFDDTRWLVNTGTSWAFLDRAVWEWCTP